MKECKKMKRNEEELDVAIDDYDWELMKESDPNLSEQ
jgi:hypothetical protein